VLQIILQHTAGNHNLVNTFQNFYENKRYLVKTARIKIKGQKVLSNVFSTKFFATPNNSLEVGSFVVSRIQ
jgi:hypothetical protein